MVSFRNLLVSSLALVTPISAVLSPAQIAANIDSLTTKSQALISPAESINVVNGPWAVFGLGPFPKIIFGLTDIATTAAGAIYSMQGTPDIPAGVDSDVVFNAFRDFVQAHQALLNILIGKAGLFATSPVIGTSVSTALRTIKGVVDPIGLGLVDIVESHAADLTALANSLSQSIDEAITKYDGLKLVKRHESQPLSLFGRRVAAH